MLRGARRRRQHETAHLRVFPKKLHIYVYIVGFLIIWFDVLLLLVCYCYVYCCYYHLVCVGERGIKSSL